MPPSMIRVHFAEIQSFGPYHFHDWTEDFNSLREAVTRIQDYERLDGAVAVKIKSCITLLYFIERLDS